jgi:hypothetical protein
MEIGRAAVSDMYMMLIGGVHDYEQFLVNAAW